MADADLWADGLICAFELIRGRRKWSNGKCGPKVQRVKQAAREVSKKHDLAFGRNNAFSSPTNGNKISRVQPTNITNALDSHDYDGDSNSGHLHGIQELMGCYWVPIGWARISELVQTVEADAGWVTQRISFSEDEGMVTVADVATPYWERPVGPTWWCHVAAEHPSVKKWLNNAQWLHPAIGIALLDESRLISERMKHLLYEVHFRVTIENSCCCLVLLN